MNSGKDCQNKMIQRNRFVNFIFFCRQLIIDIWTISAYASSVTLPGGRGIMRVVGINEYKHKFTSFRQVFSRNPGFGS
jgi:hypothetical protein